MNAALVAAGPLDGVGQFLGHLYSALAFLAYPFSIVLGALYHFFNRFELTAAIGAYGLAIIVLTIAIKSVLFPLYQYQLKVQKKTQAEQRKIAPELAALRKKYKGDAQKLNTEMMALYKEHGINPFGGVLGCLPLLLQMPVLIGLYRAIWQPPVKFLPSGAAHQYFVGLDMQIPAAFGNPVTWILPALAGLTTFIQSRMIQPPQAVEGDDQAAQMAQMTQSMSFLMPLLIVFFSFQPYALQGLVLYWVVSNLFSIAQQYRVNGWGQLPFLGTGGGGGVTAPAAPATGVASGSARAKTGQGRKGRNARKRNKIAAARAELSSRSADRT